MLSRHAATVVALELVFSASAHLAHGADDPIPVPAVALPPAPPVVQAAPAAEREAGRIDEEGFPKWPLFDERAVKETLEAIRSKLKAHADAVGVADAAAPAKPKLKRKPKAPPSEPKPDPLFEFEPEYTEGAFANLPNGAYSGAVVAPNRKIYFIPFNAATVLVYDTDRGTTKSINLPNGHGTDKYIGGVLGPNGCIYCAPFHQAAEVAVIDTKTDEVRLLFARSGSFKWRGGVAAANGKVYWPPDQAGVVFTVDTAHGDITGEFANNPPFPQSGFSGAAIGGDGRIYFAPLDSRTCFRVDTRQQDKVESFGNAPGGGFAYQSAVTGPDGRVYCVPANADHVLVIDPAGPSAAPLQFPGNKPVHGRWKYVGGVLGPDGNIYCIPGAESRILVIDTPKQGKPEATLRYWGREMNGNFVEYRQEKFVEFAYHGGVLGPDGRIYFVPFNAKHLLAIGKKKDVSMNRVLSPMFNKF